MKIIELFNGYIMLYDKYISVGPLDPYIDVSANELTFLYESGLTDTINITSNVNYTITTGVSWIGINHTSGSGNLLLTVEMLTSNTGIVNRTGTITIENTENSIIKIISITQNYDTQPLLYIMTDGGSFNGVLT